MKKENGAVERQLIVAYSEVRAEPKASLLKRHREEAAAGCTAKKAVRQTDRRRPSYCEKEVCLIEQFTPPRRNQIPLPPLFPFSRERISQALLFKFARVEKERH